MSFRDLTVAASLKQHRGPSVLYADQRFPRPNRRGLIEAAVVMILPSNRTDFPRPNRRGLIEAQELCSMTNRKLNGGS